MSTTIIFPELDTLRSQATKYLVEKVGYNIRPGEPLYDKELKTWTIPCTAHVSNYVSNEGEDGKQFIYRFENIDKLIYIENEDGIQLIQKPKKMDIEQTIFERYLYLTREIEKQILIAGSSSWGKLTLVKYFLSPLYSMISNLFDREYLSIKEINTEQNYKFFKLLLNIGYINVDSENENIFIISNKLKNLGEQQYDINEVDSIFAMTENIVGIIYGNNYDTIKFEFGIRPPSSYVDYTKAYYFDALRYGDIIRVDETDMLFSLQNFNIFINDKLNFKKSLMELANTNLMNKEEEYYYGSEKIYSDLYSFRDGLIAGAEEI